MKKPLWVKIVHKSMGLVSICSIDFCHCDMSLWSVSNRKGRLTIGQQFPALLREEVFMVAVTKYCAGRRKLLSVPINFKVQVTVFTRLALDKNVNIQGYC